MNCIRDINSFFKRRGRFARQPQNDKKTFQKGRDDKNGKSERKCFRCGDPNYLIGECLKPPRDKNQRAFVGGSWSDSGEEDDEKIQDETCLVAQSPNEVCSESSYFSDENTSIDDLDLDNEYDKLCKMSLKIITKNKMLKAIRNSLENELKELKDRLSILEKNKGVDLDCAKCHTLKIENEKLKKESTRLNKFEKSTHCLNKMLNNQKSSGDKLVVWGFNTIRTSSSGTKEIEFVKAQKKTSSDGDHSNVTNDETPPPSKELHLSYDDLDEEEAIREIEKKNLENAVEDETLEIDDIVNIKESRNHPLENVIGNLNQRTLRMLKKFSQEESKPLKTPIPPILNTQKMKSVSPADIPSIEGMKSTTHLGLWYPKGTGIETVVYADSDHAGDYVDRKSTSGICTFVGCCLTSWFSKKQTALAISTTEAEYVSAGKACQQALWMKQALIDYDVRLDDVPIMCDNKGAIDLSKNPVQHSRTKHIEIRHHFLRDNVQKGHISIEKVPSVDNIADILTKPLKRESFNYLRLGLGMMEHIP
ncbi:hypothetical protein Tco_0266624 [Tanacetum coccineum]